MFLHLWFCQLGKYFDAEVYSFDLHITKPATLMWEKALELLNLDANIAIKRSFWSEAEEIWGKSEPRAEPYIPCYTPRTK